MTRASVIHLSLSVTICPSTEIVFSDTANRIKAKFSGKVSTDSLCSFKNIQSEQTNCVAFIILAYDKIFYHMFSHYCMCIHSPYHSILFCCSCCIGFLLFVLLTMCCYIDMPSYQSIKPGKPFHNTCSVCCPRFVCYRTDVFELC